MPDARSQEISKLAAELETLKIKLQNLESRSELDQLTCPLTPEDLISSYSLTDLVHIETLQGLLDHFLEATGLTTGLLTPKGDLLAFAGKPARICMKLIRGTETGLLRCRAMLEKAREERKSCFGLCHAGMFDGAVPIVVQGIIKGFLVIGQVLTESPNREKALAYAKELGIPGEEYLEALQELAIVDAHHILSGAKLLEFVGNQIANQAATTIILQQEVRTRKQTQKKLEDANDLLTAVLNGIPGYLNILDRDMNILNVNDNMLAVSNFPGSRDSVIGRKCHQVFHGTGELCPQCLVPQVMQTCTPMTRETVPKDSIMTAGREQKAYIAPILGSDGEVIGAVEAIMDISDLKRTERALRESENRLRTIIDNAPVMIVSFDENRRFSLCNKECERQTGWTIHELNSPPFAFEELFPDPEDLTRAYSQIGKASGQFHEYNLMCSNGSVVPQAWANFCLSGGEFIAMGYDLTDTKRMEQEILHGKEKAEAANRAKSTFLANMSHDLRTPLNGIEGMLQLMIMNRLEPEQQRLAETALKSCHRLTRLLGDILDLSKVEAGQLNIQPASFCLTELLHSIRDLFDFPARQSDISLVIEKKPGTPESLLGDEHRIQQILFNLVGNALKFTTKGEIRVTVQPGGAVAATDSTSLTFTVSDTGRGIPAEMQADIFKPFSQGENFKMREGVGLGLAIVRKLTDLMHGEVHLISQEGEGTKFRVTLPLGIGEKRTCSASPKRYENAYDPLPEGKRVLVVEDDNVNMLVLRKLFQELGLEIAEARDGQQALEQLRQDRFDLILTDVQMPVMSGIAMTDIIRNTPEFREIADIPIIALSAFAMTEDRNTFLGSGMTDTLSKPIEFKELFRTLRRNLR
ncbi:MAG TPA: PocR ligand-binding domain-containing protein [Desulfomicrobiaceae bacterium]|nr:PocR ligand-binding domain-containing protein [Desulfomicrobiaceae bacterium]